MRTPDIEGASIVMLGSFNPAIFQPRWLGAQKLVRPEEAENAKIAVVSAEVADFSTEWFHLQVLQNRFQVASADPRQYAPLRDLASAVFTILPYTPVSAIGMNRSFHFKMPSIDAWHAVGHRLAPKEAWNAVMETPGLRSMTMEGRRADEKSGTLRVKIEPSTKVEHGIFVEVNEEFKSPPPDTSQGEEVGGAQWVPQRLAENWESVMKFADSAAENLLRLAQ